MEQLIYTRRDALIGLPLALEDRVLGFGMLTDRWAVEVVERGSGCGRHIEEWCCERSLM
jgi:hypothetical protein